MSRRNGQQHDCTREVSYAIASSGRDGLWKQRDLRSYTRGAISSFDGDIVLESGSFIRYPEWFRGGVSIKVPIMRGF